MNCNDCKEPVTEYERRDAVRCYDCGASLHSECAMSDYNESKPRCEPCFYQETGRRGLKNPDAPPPPNMKRARA